MILHICSEDSTAGRLGLSGLGGVFLPWYECWCDGPVPSHVTRSELEEQRLRYFAASEDIEEAREWSQRIKSPRNEAFAKLNEIDEIVFWFNSTVSEQLNLIDVLTQLQEMGAECRYSRATGGNHRFRSYRSKELGVLGAERTKLDPLLVEAAPAAWLAFRQSDPKELQQFLASTSTRPSELWAALQRFLEELPSATNGLSRFEAFALSALSRSELTPMLLWVEHLESWRSSDGDPLFNDLSDGALRQYLVRLGGGPHPLIEHADGSAIPPKVGWDDTNWFSRTELRLTRAGARVLDGEDYIALNRPRRWLGPYRLEEGYPDWRWDAEAHKVTRRSTDQGQ